MRFIAISTEQARAYRTGSTDANGQAPERRVAERHGLPCRHCLDMIPKGQGILVLAYRPFATVQPYAETGPIFLCEEACVVGGGSGTPAFLDSPQYILRGYGVDERIIYGTGGVVATQDIPARASELFDTPNVAFIHVRSASNNCFHCRIER